MKTKPSKALTVQKPTIPPAVRARSRRGDQVVEMVPLVLKVKRILVPVDFSKASEKALRYAVAFGRQLEAKISLLHVQQVPYASPDTMMYPGMAPLSARELERAAIERLHETARRLIPANAFGRAFIRTGVPFDEICKAATEAKAYMIIISTHGYTGFRHVLLGSTAERVVRHAGCPVLVVREKEHEFA